MKASVLTVSAVLGLTIAAGTAHAGIVNIDARANGESGMSALINPVQYAVAPGTYRISDAWSVADGLEAGALYDAWNFQSSNPTAWA